jgi:hypothetical protein
MQSAMVLILDAFIASAGPGHSEFFNISGTGVDY